MKEQRSPLIRQDLKFHSVTQAVYLKVMLAVGLLPILLAPSLWANDIKLIKPKLPFTPALMLDSIFERIEKGHPLLKRTQINRMVAQGKLLKALGKFEPKLVNDWELERLVKNGSTKNVGFNDTLLELKHPSGIKGFVGYRIGIGDVEVADLGVNTTNQPLLGIVIPLLRNFIDNPANAELKKSSLADRQAQLEIQQARQDLYLGAATQYWNWVAAQKISIIKKKGLQVAQERLTLIKNQEKSGARARFDVIDARQEVQWRKGRLIRAKRKMEKEQFKLALFMWENQNLVIPRNRKAPAFPPARPKLTLMTYEQDRLTAISRRPEIKQLNLQAEYNQIDLDLAENTKLPDLTLEAEPTRKPGEFVLGLGYRFGAKLTIPFMQREARGEMLQAQGESQRLRMLKQYRVQKVNMDVENARSSLLRAAERVNILKENLHFARELEQGERDRFKLGASNLVIVNMRERNALKARENWIKAMAEYQKSVALYQWSTGKWTQGSMNENNPKSKEISR